MDSTENNEMNYPDIHIVMKCINPNCMMYTSKLECEQRVFRNNRCGYCGSKLTKRNNMKKQLAANEVMFSEGNEIHFTTVPDYHSRIRIGIPSDVVYSVLAVNGRHRLHTDSPGVPATIFPIGVTSNIAATLQQKAVPHVDYEYQGMHNLDYYNNAY